MKTRIAVLLTILIALIVGVYGCASVEDFSDPRDTVKLISNGEGNGSGVVIAPNLVLTAKHVAVYDGFKIDGRDAKTLRMAEESDLGLLGVEVGCPCAMLAAYPAQRDELVIVVGFPYNSYIQAQVLTTGRAQGVSSEGQLVLTAAALPGNSGGGVFVHRNGRYELAGILVAGHPGGTLTLAVDVESIRKFLA